MRSFAILAFFVLLFAQAALGQSYNMTVNVEIWDAVDNSSHRCGNYFSMKLYFSDGSSSTIFGRQDLTHDGNTHEFYSSGVSFSKVPTSIEIYGERNWHNAIRCKGTDGTNYFSIPGDFYCWGPTTYTDIIPEWGSKVTFQIVPSFGKVSSNEGSIYSTDNVKVSVTDGYPSNLYKWTYGIGSPDDNNLINGASGSSIDIPVNSITSQSNVMLYVSASLCNLPSVDFIYTIKQSPPTVTGISTTSPKCNGGNGSVTLQFSRALVEGETLTLFYNSGSDYTQHYSSVLSLDSNNLAVVNDIDTGTYNYSIGYTYNGSQSVTAGNGTFTIAQPSMITASVTPPAEYCDPSAKIGVTASGGTGSYKYNMTSPNGSSSGTFVGSGVISNSGSGHYEITITDSNDCLSNLQTFGFDVYFALTAFIQASDIKCSSDLVVLIANASGGKPGIPNPYTYEWFNQNGESIGNGKTLENIGSGNYKLVVTDGGGQTEEAYCQVTVPDEVDLHSSAVTDILCNGSSTGAITVEPKGGSGTYRYSWSGSNGFTSTDKNLAGLRAGTYNLTLTDSKGCSAKETPYTFIVEEQSEGFRLTEIYTISTDGFGRAGGELGLTVSGGTPFDTGYSISYSNPAGASPNEQKNWSNGVCTYRLTNLIAGTYNVTFTDSNGCSTYYSFAVTAPPPLEMDISATQIKCNGTSDGSITVRAYGGKPMLDYTYEFRWLKNGGSFQADNYKSNTSVLNNLSAGTYQVTVEDSKNNVTTSNAMTIVEPLVLTLNSAVTDVLCFGKATGKIILDIQGGTAPYRYVWSSGQTSRDLVSVVARDYSVVVTDSHGCSVSWSGTIHQPTSAVAQHEVLLEHPLKIGGKGKLEVAFDGGIPPYTYQWLNSSGTVISSGTDSPASLSDVKAGNYTLSVTDANKCNLPITYALIDPPPLVVNLIQSQLISCFGNNDGQLRIQASGGVLASTNRYIYEWYKAVSLTDSTLLEKSQIAETLTNLGPDTYFGWVEDKGGTRIRTKDLTITQPETLTMNATPIGVSCFGGNDGIINITVTGGTPPYLIKWTSGVHTGQQTQAITGDGQITGLFAGTYTVNITDSHQCGTTISTNVGQPVASLTITTQKYRGPTGAGLSTGLIQAQISGGTPDYEYQLKNSSGVVVVEKNGSTVDVTNLPQGTYTLTARDNNYNSTVSTSRAGCTAAETYILTDPLPLVATIAQTQSINCFGEATGRLHATVAGGIQLDEGGYYYNWYKVLAPGDSLKLNDTGSMASNLTAGRYVLKAIDLFSIKTYSNVIEIGQPTRLEASSVQEATRCFGGSDGKITLSVSGGVTPYSCAVAYGGTQTSYNIDPSGRIVFPELLAGTYTITVFDANSCQKQLNVEVKQPDAALEIDFPVVETPTGAGLKNGRITASITGGTPPYQYLWTDVNNKILHAGTGSQTEITGLGSGFYQLSVTDANYNSSAIEINKSGCLADLSYFMDEPKPLVVTVKQTGSVLCYGDSKGEITATTSGGVQIVGKGYNYLWYEKRSATDSLLLTNRTNSLEKGWRAGTYFVWVTDKNNNKARSSNITIIEPTPLQVSHTFGDVTCFGGSNGYIRSSAFGGTPPYSYYWSNGSSTSELNHIPVGNYSLTVTDLNGCSVTIHQSIISPSAPVTLIAEILPPTEYKVSNGKISITASGGKPPYTCLWTKVDGSKVDTDDSGNAINLGDGYYTLKLTDSNYHEGSENNDNKGCLQEFTYHVIEPPLLVAGIHEKSPVVCKGEAQGSLQATTTGGVPFKDGTYQYKWSRINGIENTYFSGSGSTISDLAVGLYRMEVTDANGVTKESTFTLTEPELLQIDLNKSTVPVNSLEAIVSGGKPPYRFLWNTGQQTAKISNIDDGGYFVWVTDALGCDIFKGTSIGSTVYDPTVPVIALTLTNPDCTEACNGSAMATLSAGTPPYRLDWGSGSTDNLAISNLCAGSYKLVVTDAKQKTASQTFILKDPEQLIIPIEKQASFCKGQVYKANATVALSGATYYWTSDNGFISSNPKVEIKKGGKYSITVTGPTGCQTSASIVVTEKDDPGITLDYVLASQAMASQEIVLVNTTSGNAGQMEWILPPEAKVNEMSLTVTKIVFEKAGNYPIGLKSQIDGCTIEKVKNLTVTPYSSDALGDNSNGLRFVDVSVYPNPNDGQFTVKVELSQTTAISMYLIDSASYKVLWTKTMSGSDLYETTVNMARPVSGLYLLLVEISGGSTTRKVVVL